MTKRRLVAYVSYLSLVLCASALYLSDWGKCAIAPCQQSLTQSNSLGLPQTEISTEQLRLKAQAITVKVMSDEFLGSGILLKKNNSIYTIVTNAHVLRSGNSPYWIQTPDGTAKGMSGGAILNEQDELIGIHGRAITEASEEDPQQFVIRGALGITIYSALRQMLTVGVDVGVRPPGVVATAPKADDFYLKGNEKYSQKDYKGAIADYTEAIRLNPNYIAAYYNRGLVRSALGDKQGAIADYNSALKINPNDAKAYLNRGVAYYALGNLQLAIADSNSALKINPKLWIAISNISFIKYDQGDVEVAIKQWQAALAIDNKAVDPLLALAVALHTKGEREQALTKAKQALTIDKQYADLAFLKKNLWSDRLLADTKKLLATPEIKMFLLYFRLKKSDR
ncbi:tetratricopeptide repeat protein [Chlorogloeopsis sp. ULAP02]|uniref:tetratricopeptide repeat protein n=1 Tax=Chlorogloeopsis sp. ULAP02 TaxID=3107926 RepID=UPI003134F00F